MVLATSRTGSTHRVLVLLDIRGGWSRGVLRGFMAAAEERNWLLLHYHPSTDLSWLVREWAPAATVVGPEPSAEALSVLAPGALVSVATDRSAQGIPSVCIDEQAVAALALEHLLSTGVRQLTTFRFDDSPFAVARELAFVARARAMGARVAPGWGCDERPLDRRGEDPSAIVDWLRGLPKPCGVFACTDSWGRTLARYAQVSGVRIPEQLSIVGVDNDVLQCELMAPSLSSVMIPWQEVGQRAAAMVAGALGGRLEIGTRTVVSPTTVLARRSSEVLAIDDPLVEQAVRWIRAHADRRLTVPMVASAVGGGRQRLERRFRAVLDRTVLEEIRRAHVEAAKLLLATTSADLRHVAKQSGFATAGVLNGAFLREVGTTPGAYRRRVAKELRQSADDGAVTRPAPASPVAQSARSAS
jgi:LacI family transcriptional regulator